MKYPPASNFILHKTLFVYYYPIKTKSAVSRISPFYISSKRPCLIVRLSGTILDDTTSSSRRETYTPAYYYSPRSSGTVKARPPLSTGSTPPTMTGLIGSVKSIFKPASIGSKPKSSPAGGFSMDNSACSKSCRRN